MTRFRSRMFEPLFFFFATFVAFPLLGLALVQADVCCNTHDDCKSYMSPDDGYLNYYAAGTCWEGWCDVPDAGCAIEFMDACRWTYAGSDYCSGDTVVEYEPIPGDDLCTTFFFACSDDPTEGDCYYPTGPDCGFKDWYCSGGYCQLQPSSLVFDGCYDDYGTSGCQIKTHYCPSCTPVYSNQNDDWWEYEYYCPDGTSGDLYRRILTHDYYCSSGACVDHVSAEDGSLYMICDDQNPCTADSCDEIEGCLNDPIPNCGAPIPTLTEWGLIIFITVMMGIGVMTIMRKRKFA